MFVISTHCSARNWTVTYVLNVVGRSHDMSCLKQQNDTSLITSAAAPASLRTEREKHEEGTHRSNVTFKTEY